MQQTETKAMQMIHSKE